tara:strand:+ start:934 stop:1215 length:282 start_codon:yes stop_codon:yes gene_type:complete
MSYKEIFDFLSLVHLCFFYIIGLFLKNNYVFAFILGIIWEIVEYGITSTRLTRELLIKYWPVPKRIWDEKLFNPNRLSDLIFNMIGYHLAQIK